MTIAAALVSLGFCVSIVNSAWVSDDAYITFRTIDNLVNGFGLRWNVAERVQTFTHPLWLFLLTVPYAIFGNIYYVVLVTSCILSVATVWYLARYVADHWLGAVWIGIAFVTSKAYIDYSTSGLENPLSHAILVVYLVTLSRCRDDRRLIYLVLLAAFGALNRLDSIVLLAPSLGLELWTCGFKRALRPVLIGLAPVLVWLAFSTFYYGTPFPNTAYAKLSTEVPRATLLTFGSDYLVHSAELDPITLTVILAAIVLAFVRKQSRLLVAGGVGLQLVYLVWIGGDFMSGRFLTTAYLVSVVSICTSITGASWPLVLGLTGAAIVGCMPPASPVWARWDDDLSVTDLSGVVDERAAHFRQTGLHTVLSTGAPTSLDGQRMREERHRVAVCFSIGIVGYSAGPGVHIVDQNALADPFLARLPAAGGLLWRPGHYPRSLPRGYVETVWKGENRILSPSFSEFYERVFLITRGDLFSWSRLSQVVEMNLGFYDHLLPSSLDMVAFDAAEELSEIEGEGGRESETIDVNDLLRLADRFLEAGDAGRASVAWGTARSMGAQGEQFLDTCARLGELLNQGDHGRLAMKVLTMCAQGAPEDLDIQTRLAQSLFSQGEFVEAAAAGKRGFDFSEPRVEPLEVVADVMNIRRVPEAEMNYRAILVLDPENEHAKEELLVIQSEMPNLQ